MADDVYDLRAVSQLLATRRGLRFDRCTFQAAFSRAVAGLIRKGVLVKPGLVPIRAVEKDPYQNVEHFMNGDYMHAGRETRFVRLAGDGCLDPG